MASGGVDDYIKVHMSPSEVEKCRTDGRDVYRVPDRDLQLTPDKNPTFGKTGEEGKKQEKRPK